VWFFSVPAGDSSVLTNVLLVTQHGRGVFGDSFVSPADLNLRSKTAIYGAVRSRNTGFPAVVPGFGDVCDTLAGAGFKTCPSIAAGGSTSFCFSSPVVESRHDL
jgi:hypothetical protein